MGITIKTSDQIHLMKQAGAILDQALRAVASAVTAGISTEELDHIAHTVIQQMGGEPAFLGYKGYPKTLCTSINSEVVHGIPSAERILNKGDIIGLDLGVRYKGWHADKAVSVGVGNISLQATKLIETTSQALEEAIGMVKPGVMIHDIAKLIQGIVERQGFSIVRDLVGHGIGRELHEDPQVPNFVSKKFPNLALKEGMVIAVEPMVIAGDWKVNFVDDDWTVESADKGLAAHFEETIAVTKNGHEVLTR